VQSQCLITVRVVAFWSAGNNTFAYLLVAADSQAEARLQVENLRISGAHGSRSRVKYLW